VVERTRTTIQSECWHCGSTRHDTGDHPLDRDPAPRPVLDGDGVLVGMQHDYRIMTDGVDPDCCPTDSHKGPCLRLSIHADDIAGLSRQGWEPVSVQWGDEPGYIRGALMRRAIG